MAGDPPRLAAVAAGHRGLLGNLEAVPLQEAGEPVWAGEDLGVDPGVARVLSQFGSTACKAQYRCDTCLEPFDYFKPH